MPTNQWADSKIGGTELARVSIYQFSGVTVADSIQRRPESAFVQDTNAYFR